MTSKDILDELEAINKEVLKVLGSQKDNVVVIKDKKELGDYISKCIEMGVISVDTETNNSLDPLTCLIMGLCLYGPGTAGQAYVPINHRDPVTKERLSYQLSESDIKKELLRVKSSGIKVIMHNGKFDYEVLKCTCGVELPPYWDTMIGAKLLNENEQSGLKHQYVKKIDKTQSEYKIEKLFKNVPYSYVDPDIFALYSATDSLMTYKLYEYQVNEFKKEENEKLLKLFFDIEIPMVPIVAEMELHGALVDVEYSRKLKDKYDQKLKEIDVKILKELNLLQPMVDQWKKTQIGQLPERVYPSSKIKRKTNVIKFEKVYDQIDDNGDRYKFGKKRCDLLDTPIKVSSPKQLSILFFYVFNLAPVLSIKPTGTGKNELNLIGDQLKDWEDDIKFCLKNRKLKDLSYEDLDKDDEDGRGEVKRYKRTFKECSNFIFEDNEESLNRGLEIVRSGIRLSGLLLERREVDKLITTYLNVVPSLASHWGDGKIRFQLNPLGARTGRFSSGGKWKFLVDDKVISLSGMNSQNLPAKNHEVRLMFKASEGSVFVGGDFSQQEPKLTAFLSQDPKMLETYRLGKDIYAVIAQSIYKNKYEDNLEFFDKEKKKINLEGKERRSVGKVVILATMYGMGPSTLARQLGVDKFKAESMLEDFFEEFSEVKKVINSSQMICRNLGYIETTLKGYCRRRRLPNIQLPKYKASFISTPKLGEEESKRILYDYLNRTKTTDGSFLSPYEFKVLKEEALQHKILIESNEFLIKKAERQCFNSRIQGSAATLTKKTMILINEDQLLKNLGAHLVFQIHDELIMECPVENSEKVKERLNEIMVRSVDTLGITVGMKCDVVVENRWGEEAMTSELKEEYEKLVKKRVKKPLEELYKIFPNFPEDSIKKVICDETDVLEF